MVGVSFVGILVLLMIFGACAVVVGLIVLAAAKGRPGLAALIAGLAIVVPIVIGTFAALFVSYTVRSTPMSENDWHMEVSPGGPQMAHQQTPSHIAIDSHGTSSTPQATYSGNLPQVSFSNTPQTHWRVSLVPVMFILFGGIALLALVARRSFGHAAAGGHGRIWPAFVALPIFAIFFFGSVRYHSSSTWTSDQATVSEVSLFQPRQQQKVTIPNQQLVQVTKQLQSQIEHVDIHELMDKFDAPRIVLQTPVGPAAAPVVLAIAVASQAEAQPAELPEVKPKQRSAAKASNKRSSKPPAEQPSKSAEIPGEAVAVSASAPAEVAKIEKAASKRPEWIDETPKRTGHTRRDLIVTDEYESIDECYQAADVYLMLKTYDHLMDLSGQTRYDITQPSISFTENAILVDGRVISAPEHSSVDDNRLRQLNDMGIGIDYLRREIVAKDPKDNESREYIENTTRSIGPMKKLYMQIEFTPAVDRELLQLWDASRRKDRFAFVGAGAASVLGLLGMVWGLLRADTATKGYYTKRLFIGVPIAIIGGALVLLSTVF